MTPIQALDRAIARGGYPSLVSSRRFRRWSGRPGEIVERLDAETRSALCELRSADVAPTQVPRDAAWLASDEELDPGLLAYRSACKRFDRNVLHLNEGPRIARRKTSVPWS